MEKHLLLRRFMPLLQEICYPSTEHLSSFQNTYDLPMCTSPRPMVTQYHGLYSAPIHSILADTSKKTICSSARLEQRLNHEMYSSSYTEAPVTRSKKSCGVATQDVVSDSLT